MKWEQIIADLHNADDVDRAVAAIDALDRVADPSRLPELYKMLTEGRDFFIREAAAVPVARMEGLRALPQLLIALELGEAEGHDNDGLVFNITELVSFNALEAVPILRQMLESPSEKSRADAAWLLGYVHEAITPELLIAVAKEDSSLRVRSAALGSLSIFKGNEDVFEVLVRMLRSEHPGLRADAASALGYFEDQRAEPELRIASNDSAEEVRSAAKHGLEHLQRGLSGL